MSTPDIAEERRLLTVEIFAITGQKLAPDDPAVTAALFYSAKVREAAKEIEAASRNASKSIEESVNKAVVAATKIETVKAQSQLATFADGLKKKLTISQDAPNEDTKTSRKLILGFGSALVIVGFCGVVVGATAFSSNSGLSPADQKNLQYGTQLIAALPYLDKTTRQKLMTALEKSAQQAHSK